MNLLNHTPYSAGIFRTVIEDNLFAAAVIVRVLYDLNGEEAIPNSNNEWPVSMQAWENEYGAIESDAVFYKGGIDLFVFGNACAPDKRLVNKMDVKVTAAGSLIHSMIVFGNRVWKNGVLGMTFTDPEPFSKIPLTLSNAYGGNAEWDGLKIPYGNNLRGKGFYWNKENAVGQPLPNIEDPKNLIRNWNDRPDPTGVAYCPVNELRMRGNIETGDDGIVSKISPLFFNTAFPSMILKNVLPGEKIVVEGVTPNGNFSFKVPTHKLEAKLCLGEKLITSQLTIDQIGLLTDKNQAFITYRYPFKYFLYPMQKRICEIFEVI